MKTNHVYITEITDAPAERPVPSKHSVGDRITMRTSAGATALACSLTAIGYRFAVTCEVAS